MIGEDTTSPSICFASILIRTGFWFVIVWVFSFLQVLNSKVTMNNKRYFIS